MTPDRVGDALSTAGIGASPSAPIGPLTTYRVGGTAAWLVEVGSPDDLRRLAGVTAATGVPTLVVGKGSNLLVADRGFDGVAVQLGDGFAAVVVDGHRVTAGGAASLPVVARRTVAAGLTGFEWAVGVPGSVGGAVRMNAGGHGSDMAASVVQVRVLELSSGQDVLMTTEECEFGYRSSSIGPGSVVVDATLELAEGDPAAGEVELSEIVAWRRRHQPGGQNAGSVFANPPGDSAGRLIEAAGCKGLRVGSAEVSTKHANFFQADADGSADDVAALMAEVRRRVEESSGVALRAETRLVGFTADEMAAAGATP